MVALTKVDRASLSLVAIIAKHNAKFYYRNLWITDILK